MFRNYFKIAYRNLLKYRAYSLINIFGLIAIVTVSYQAIRAATSNPVKALRSE